MRFMGELNALAERERLQGWMVDNISKERALPTTDTVASFCLSHVGVRGDDSGTWNSPLNNRGWPIDTW